VTPELLCVPILPSLESKFNSYLKITSPVYRRRLSALRQLEGA